MALVGTLQIGVLRQKATVFFWIVLFVVLALYVVMFYFVLLRGIRPRTHRIPISRVWKELAQRYFDEEVSNVLDSLISDYLKSLDDIRQVATGKATALNVAIWLFFAIVVILLAVMPFALS